MENCAPQELMELVETNEEGCFEIWDMEDRIIFLKDTIDDSLRDLFPLLWQWNREDFGKDCSLRTPIKLLIDSAGGDMLITSSLIDLLDAMSTPLITINLGMCYSAACSIFVCGWKRYSLSRGMFLIHDGEFGFSPIAQSKAYSLIDKYKKLDEILQEDFVQKTNLTAKEMSDKGVRDWYLFVPEAIEIGLVDDILHNLDQILEITFVD